MTDKTVAEAKQELIRAIASTAIGDGEYDTISEVSADIIADKIEALIKAMLAELKR